MTTLRDHRGNRQRRLARTLLGVCLGVVSTAGLTHRNADAAGSGPAVAVPAYFWATAQWDRMLMNSTELRYVVLNPDSGPGSVSYPTFVTKVAAARSQGAVVVGYVDTTYAARPLAAVKADIDRYRAWYGVNAFFFDQTPYDCADIAYYDELKTYVRAESLGLIFHNPGMNPQECYLNAADVIVNFEGSEATYAGWTPAAYASTYPADRFWHIVYSVDPTHGPALRTTATERNAGLVYLTEQAMPNPFSVIPSDALWDAQTPTRNGRRAAPQVPSPSTSTPGSGRPNAPQSGTPRTTTTAPEAAPSESIATGAPATTTTTSTPASAGPTTTSTPTSAGPTTAAPTSTSAPITSGPPPTTAPEPSPMAAPAVIVPPAPVVPSSPVETFEQPTPAEEPTTTRAIHASQSLPTTTVGPTTAPVTFAAPALIPTTPAVPRVGATRPRTTVRIPAVPAAPAKRPQAGATPTSAPTPSRGRAPAPAVRPKAGRVPVR